MTLADARRSAGLTMEQLAERLGVALSTVSRRENGDVRLSDARAWLVACGITDPEAQAPYLLGHGEPLAGPQEAA